MSLILRSFRRNKKNATKFKFTIIPEQLTLDYFNSTKKKRCQPKQILIVFMHRHQRYECKPRNTEVSFTNPCRSIVSWPSAIADAISFNVTMFKSKNQEYDEKEWTVIVEEVLKNKNTRPLAALSLNLCLFVSYKAPIKAKFKLRSLRPEVKLCTLNMSIFLLSFDSKINHCKLEETIFNVPENNEFLKKNIEKQDEETLELLNEAATKEIENFLEEYKDYNSKGLSKVDSKKIAKNETDCSVQLIQKNLEKNINLTNITNNFNLKNDNVKNNLNGKEKTNEKLVLQEVERLGLYLKKKMKDIEETENKPLITKTASSDKEEPPKIQSRSEKFLNTINEVKKNFEMKTKPEKIENNNKNVESDIIPTISNEEMVTEDAEISSLNIKTRKITTNFEKDLRNSISCIQVDLEQMNERLLEVGRLDSYIEEKMQITEAGSENERMLIEQHLKLLTEKDALVRRQDYLNVLIDLKETTSKIEDLQKKLNEITTDELYHTNKTEKLMLELKELIDRKDELSHTLIEKEDEEEEESERSKRLVQESYNFMRGSVEPLSASKRILNWFNPKTSF